MRRDYECPKSRKGINLASKNGQWKGESVSYGALHDWVKYHLSKPSICEACGQSKRLDLANKSGKYKRDLSDWAWLCRRCHMISDSRLTQFADLVRKNPLRGELNPRAILTETDVLNIRARTDRSGKQLAIIFGVDPRTISAIKRRKIWRHV